MCNIIQHHNYSETTNNRMFPDEGLQKYIDVPLKYMRNIINQPRDNFDSILIQKRDRTLNSNVDTYF